jgi:predicted transcriptional regulator
MTKTRPTRQIGIRLSPEILAWLEAIAKEQDHSVPHVIRRKLEAEFAREMKKTKPAKG